MADMRLNAIGIKCPKPLFEVHKKIGELTAGQTLQIQADDPAFKLDIEAWCRRTGHQLLELGQEDAIYTATIEKTA